MVTSPAATTVVLNFKFLLLGVCGAFILCSLVTILLFHVKLDNSYAYRAQILAYRQSHEKLEEELLSTQQKLEAVTRKNSKALFQPLGDLRLRTEREDQSTVLCFVFSTILSTGGVEQWFWTLYYNIFTKPPYTVYALQIMDIFNHDVVKHLSQEGLRFNPGAQDMIEKCDIIIQTGSQPMGDFRLARRTPRVLVIHGAVGCKWTMRYTRHAAHYSKIVAVSKDSIGTLPEDHQNRAVVITSGIDPTRLQVNMTKDDMFEMWKLPLGKKVLLYVGRISSEKDPQFFIDTVSNLPENWIGVMVGPMYFAQSTPVMTNNRTFMVGKHDNPADAYNLGDVVLLPSPSEGGPIVLLEAWPLRKPFFMRRTGLAKQHPEGVFMIETGETPASVARRILFVDTYKNDPEVKGTIEAGFDIFSRIYRIDRVAAKWKKLLDETVELTRDPKDFVVPLHISHSMTDILIKIMGRTRHIVTGDNDDHMVHLNIMKFIDLSKYTKMQVTIEYFVEKPGNNEFHMGHARFFYFDENYAQHDLTKKPLKHKKFHNILKTTFKIPTNLKGFYLSLDLLGSLAFRLSHVGLKCT